MNQNQIEIRGQKLELDTRVAVRADVIKVGSRVKLLKKDYSGHKVLHGIIIGFVLAFSLFAIVARKVVTLLGIDLDVIKDVSLVLLALQLASLPHQQKL